MSRDKTKNGFSRRDFLRSAGVAVPGGLLVGQPEPAVAGPLPPPTAGPGKAPITLRINGKVHKVELEPRVTLLDALRNHLDITGAKKVCDRGTCGACTVIMDGNAVYSCSVLAIEAQGHAITTVEGLGTPDKLHPVQAAFINHDAQQCGFCTPGFVVACKAFLDKNPSPTREQVRAGLGGNLCRCGTYVGVEQAVLEAARSRGAAKGGSNA